LFNEFDFEGDGVFEFDFEADGTLDRNEFLKLVSPTDERPAIPDPMAELEQAALAKWQAELAVADRDGDGALARDEWPGKRIAAQVPAVAEVTFEQWDRNHDAKVDVADAKWLLEVAYGLTQLDGRAVRTPTGRVFSWYFFRSLDSNHDGTLSRNEFVDRLFFEKEKNAILFDKLDADGDRQLTAEETRKFLWHDTLSNFFTFDRNLDGFLTTDEFIAIGWGKNLGLRSVRAFDGDGDGRVSFSEFRHTTFANQASDWLRPRRDADEDGRLSWKEFYIEMPPLLLAQSRYFFDHFDLDRDGFLSAAEFDFEADFAKADADHNGQLTLDEFLATYAEADRGEGARRFLVFDFDGNRKLDGDEYHSFSAPVDERGNVPDPMAEFADAALAKWEAIAVAADRNRDLALSTAEWPAKQIATEIPDLADVPFVLWDRGDDGKVDRADARWLVDVAYGLAQLDGRPLRTTTGRMFAWYFFRRHDADRNDRLARNEFMAGYHPANVNTAELFEKLDVDGDAQLTQRETWSVFCHDTIAAFLDYDRNRDGYLTADEVRAIGWGGYLARRTVPVFDDDRDGKLSFREFRLTNFANQASDWWQLKDLDHDGRIAWHEFYREKPPLLIAQSRFYFGRYDRNHDGFLSALEFPSEADPAHGQVLANADMLERVLPLEVQFAKRICRLTNDDAAVLERDGYSAIERLVEQSPRAARKNQTSLPGAGTAGPYSVAMPARTGTDLAIVRSPHLLLRRELVESMRGRLKKGGDTLNGFRVAAEDCQTLDSERVRAEKRRRQAAILAHVAVLDEALLLSARQRKDLCDLLGQDAADAWWRPINSGTIIDPTVEWFFASASGGGFYGLFVPDVELKKRLTSRQLAALTELQRPYEQEIVIVQQAAPKPGGAAVPAAVGRVAGGAVVPRAAAAPGLIAGGQVAAPRAVRRIVRRGPTVEEQQRRLAQYVEQRLDDIEAACGLSKPQRDKLSLAARLDVARWRDQSSAPDEKLNDGEELVVRKQQVRGGAAPLPLAILSDENSYFRKSLQTRLTDEQKHMLAEANGQRREFQRQAVVVAVVAGFERAASLDSAQCDGLATLLNDSLSDAEAGGTAEFVRRVAQLPFARLQAIFLDIQLPAFQQHYGELSGALRQFEVQQGNQVFRAAAGAGPGF